MALFLNQRVPELILSTAMKYGEDNRILATVTLETMVVFLDTDDEDIRSTTTVLNIGSILQQHNTRKHLQV